MQKRRKQIIVAIAIFLGSLSILVVAGVALMFVLGFPFNLTGVYFECNPKRMLNHLEKTFVIDFPEGITEVRAAKTLVSWDEGVGFKIRFVADPNTVERFLKSFPKEVELYPYRHDRDIRGSGDTPRWFTVPIIQGKQSVGSLGVGEPGASMGRLNIDTTDENNFVVYIYGGYDSELDY